MCARTRQSAVCNRIRISRHRKNTPPLLTRPGFGPTGGASEQVNPKGENSGVFSLVDAQPSTPNITTSSYYWLVLLDKRKNQRAGASGNDVGGQSAFYLSLPEVAMHSASGQSIVLFRRVLDCPSAAPPDGCSSVEWSRSWSATG